MEAVAKLKNCPLPPRKMRLLADLIRRQSVEEALNMLKLHPKKLYARHLEKLILSGVANWQNKNESASLEESDLYLKYITVDEGRVLKRIQPAPMGRAHPIKKRSNHVTIVIDSSTDIEEGEEEEQVQEQEESGNQE